MKKAARCLPGFLCILLSLSSCSSGGSGDGGGGSTPIAASNQTVVSGTVLAPGGQVAFHPTPTSLFHFASLFITEANAAVTGLSPVGDGTPVELGRLGQTTPFVFTPIASTSTSGGRYSFNLTNLRLGFSSELVVRIGSGTAQMRAFVTGAIVDLSPVSEAGVQTVLQNLGGQSPLSQLTVQELIDITGAVTILASLSPGATGNVQQSVTAFKTLIVSNGPLSSFINSAVSGGQTSQSIGDIGNFFPFNQGNTWEYRKTRSAVGASFQPYTNVHSISGTKSINGVDTLILRESNPENNENADENYILKASTGITVHDSQPADTITSQIVPYQAIRFPLSVFSKFVALSNRRITISGFPVDLSIEVNVEGFESVSVPSGTYPNALKVVTTQVATLAWSSTPAATGTETVWLVANIGPVKSMVTVTDGGALTETEIEELARATIDGIEHVAGAQVRKINLATNDLIYDRISNRIYASIPGNPGSITAINPETGSVERSVTVGNQPNKLAVSDDGQYLYVGVDGDFNARRMHLPSFTPDLTILLGTDPLFPPTTTCNPLLVSDFAVLPGNSQTVAISKRYFGCSPQFYELAVYDDATQRPNVVHRLNNVNGGIINVLAEIIEASESASALFGYTTNSELSTFSINATDITINTTAQVPSPVIIRDVKFARDKLYTNSGLIIDPSSPGSPTSFVNFPSFPIYLIQVDVLGRAFFIPDTVISGQTLSILVYDIVSRNQIGSIPVSGFNSFNGIDSVTSLIRWGIKGLAFRTSGGQVFLVQSPLIQ